VNNNTSPQCCNTAMSLKTGVIGGAYANQTCTGTFQTQMTCPTNVPWHGTGSNYVMLDAHVKFAVASTVRDQCIQLGSAGSDWCSQPNAPGGTYFWNPDDLPTHP